MVRTPAPMRPLILWLIGLAAAAGGAAQVLAGLPPRWRPLLLLAGAYGLLLGGLAGWGLRGVGAFCWRHTGRVAAPLLASLSFALSVWLGARQFAVTRAAAATDHQAALGLIMLQQAHPDDRELIDRFQAFATNRAPGFRDYLAFRMQRLGDWRTPVPELLFAAELLLAAGGAATTFARTSALPAPSAAQASDSLPHEIRSPS